MSIRELVFSLLSGRCSAYYRGLAGVYVLRRGMSHDVEEGGVAACLSQTHTAGVAVKRLS